MNRILLTAAAFAVLATAANAQPAAAPARARPTLDANGDGKVTLAEFKAAHEARQAALFARLDTNKDGKITQAEADAVSAQRGEGRGGDRDGKGGPRGRMGRHGGGHGGLMALDANKDGFVTPAEMVAPAEKRFAQLDTNKDGKVSPDEATAGKRGDGDRKGFRGHRGGHQRMGGAFVMRLDANKDGAVTKAELASRADARFAALDTNKDGWLSADELSKMRQKVRGRAGA